jgi:hypothetical protein
VQARGIKLQQNALPCPKTATLRNLDEPGCGRGATAFAARVNARHLHICVKPDGKLNGSGKAGEKGSNLLIDCRKCARAPPFRPSSHEDLQATQTLKPCRPSKQH